MPMIAEIEKRTSTMRLLMINPEHFLQFRSSFKQLFANQNQYEY